MKQRRQRLRFPRRAAHDGSGRSPRLTHKHHEGHHGRRQPDRRLLRSPRLTHKHHEGHHGRRQPDRRLLRRRIQVRAAGGDAAEAPGQGVRQGEAHRPGVELLRRDGGVDGQAKSHRPPVRQARSAASRRHPRRHERPARLARHQRRRDPRGAGDARGGGRRGRRRAAPAHGAEDARERGPRGRPHGATARAQRETPRRRAVRDRGRRAGLRGRRRPLRRRRPPPHAERLRDARGGAVPRAPRGPEDEA